MVDPIKAIVGFVSGGASSMPHYGSFLPMIPESVKFDFVGLQLYNESLYQIADKKQIILDRLQELIAQRRWDGVILTAAPTEVLNPGLFDGLKKALAVPFTTALHACVTALRFYRAKRVLLLTPFDQRLNQLICGHLEQLGVAAVAPHPFENLTVPKRMDPDDVFELTKKNLRGTDPVDAIYFQGAVLDPIKVLEKIERELGMMVIASNPAMLWHVLSKVGLAYPISGYGRLMREWPAFPEQPALAAGVAANTRLER